MNETTEYKGYLIELCFNGEYDVMKDGYLVCGDFNSINEAKIFIDTQQEG